MAGKQCEPTMISRYLFSLSLTMFKIWIQVNIFKIYAWKSKFSWKMCTCLSARHWSGRVEKPMSFYMDYEATMSPQSAPRDLSKVTQLGNDRSRIKPDNLPPGPTLYHVIQTFSMVHSFSNNLKYYHYNMLYM